MSPFHRKPPGREDDSDHWTVETLREYLLTLVESNDTRYGQRFDAQQVATNAAFIAQTTAMTTAFAAQKVAIDAAFAAQKEAVNAALAAADRAVSKAETASEKRFDSVNEFRNTLADQQRTLMPRLEAEFADKVLAEKMDIMTKQLSEKIEGTTKTLKEIQLAMTHFLSTDAYEARHEEIQRQVNDLRMIGSENSGLKTRSREVGNTILAIAGVVAVLISSIIAVIVSRIVH